MKHVTLFLLVICLGSSMAVAQSSKKNHSRFNPQSPLVHDPVMIKQGDIYYLFSTGQGVQVLSSKDFRNWNFDEPVFRETQSWVKEKLKGFKGHIWAPDILFYQGRYHLFYACSVFAKNTSIIGHASTPTLDSKSMDYKWTDHGLVLESVPYRDMWNAIDPNIIVDDEGTPWLNFGSFWDGIKMVKMEKDLMKMAQPEVWCSLVRRDRTFALDDSDPGDAAVEAPFIAKRGDYYYLYVSFDYCCRGLKSDYKIAVGRAKKVTGPYYDKEGKSMAAGGGSIIMEGNKDWAGVGHCAVYTFDGKNYLIAHGYSIAEDGASKLIVREITWDEKGWPCVAW